MEDSNSSEVKEFARQGVHLLDPRKRLPRAKKVKIPLEPIEFLSQYEKQALFPSLSGEYDRSKLFFYTYSREHKLYALNGQEFRYLWLVRMGYEIRDVAKFLNTHLKTMLTFINKASIKVHFHPPTDEFFQKFCRPPQVQGKNK